ncbi:hypothetical protein BDZ91DRAFT_664831 [Kalaharituber pfeilii]|nr:hypothetical protein BDZ91DRAFT_664831 [Kalaharituber pfeilii]
MQNAPKFLWSEAFNWAVYLKNRLPHTALQGRTPYEVLLHRRPQVGHLRPFFTQCYVHIPESTRGPGSKLEQRALEGRLVGYTGNSMYRVYIPSKRTVNESNQVRFVPNNTSSDIEFPATSSSSVSAVPAVSPSPALPTPEPAASPAPPAQSTSESQVTLSPPPPAQHSPSPIQQSMPGSFGSDTESSSSTPTPHHSVIDPSNSFFDDIDNRVYDDELD